MTGFAQSDVNTSQPYWFSPKSTGTYPKPSSSVPSKRLDCIFQSDVIANQVLVSSKDEYRDLSQQPRKDGDR